MLRVVCFVLCCACCVFCLCCVCVFSLARVCACAFPRAVVRSFVCVCVWLLFVVWALRVCELIVLHVVFVFVCCDGCLLCCMLR